MTAAIRAGRYRPGMMLPTAPILCERFGVSRITVRAPRTTAMEGQ